MSNDNRIKELTAACEAVLDAIEKTDLNGAVLWINPPYQAEGVHETAWERLRSVLGRDES